jgi:hypothetical protein
LIVLAAAVPFVPQWLANLRLDGRFHALLPDDLYGSQSLWGMELLKYATAATPTTTGSIRYVNPFYEGFPTVLEFARQRPVGYATTVLLHVFGMLDHDHVFVYVADLNPWYRWPAAVLNYCFLTLAVAGVAGMLVHSTTWPRNRVWAFASILLVAGAYVAVYAPTAVESRFGLAVDLLLTPFAILAGSRVVAAARRRQGVLPWIACLLVCVAAASWVSAWLQRQAPELVATEVVSSRRDHRYESYGLEASGRACRPETVVARNRRWSEGRACARIGRSADPRMRAYLEMALEVERRVLTNFNESEIRRMGRSRHMGMVA